MGAGASQDAPSGAHDGSAPGSSQPHLGPRGGAGYGHPLVGLAPTSEASAHVPPRPFDVAAAHDVPPPPVPFQVPVQTDAVVKNVISLRRNTLTLALSSQDPSVHLVQFEFDAHVDALISVYFAAVQTVEREGASEGGAINNIIYKQLRERICPQRKVGPGVGQQFLQTVEEGLDFRKYAQADLSFRQESKRYPVVVVLEAVFHESNPVREELRVKTHTTFANIVCTSNGRIACQVIRQEALVSGIIYVLQDLYGILGQVKSCGLLSESASKPQGFAETPDTENEIAEKGHECAICLTEACTTAVAPCRHMCLCDDCGEKLCSDSNYDRRRCPMCRSPLSGLIRMIGSRKSQLQNKTSAFGSKAEVVPNRNESSSLEPNDDPDVRIAGAAAATSSSSGFQGSDKDVNETM